MGATMEILRTEGYWWRDTPALFPRSIWHAVPSDLSTRIGLCGAATGARQVARIPRAVACPECERLSAAEAEAWTFGPAPAPPAEGPRQ
jgi:hypothetical protein